MSYMKYLNKWDKQHKTKSGMIKNSNKKLKPNKSGYVKYAGKTIKLSPREAAGGGIFANYKDNYKTKY